MKHRLLYQHRVDAVDMFNAVKNVLADVPSASSNSPDQFANVSSVALSMADDILLSHFR